LRHFRSAAAAPNLSFSHRETFSLMLTVSVYRGFPAMMIKRAIARTELADGNFAHPRPQLFFMS
jgi:hypothetical protein